MAMGIDHLVILFPKLDDAIETYRKLGFQVLPGGEHPYGTHNALVTFQDGSYLELIAFMQPEKPHDHRWYRFLDRPGLVDYALCVPDVETELERVQAAGLLYEGPKPGARQRLDGVQLEWRSIPPPDERTGELPFIIQDVTDRGLRVPTGAEAEHDNEVTGIRRLTVAVRDLGEAVDEYNVVLGTEPERGTHEELGADTATYRYGQHEIVLAYPTTPSSPLVKRIQQGGDGPFQVTLKAALTPDPSPNTGREERRGRQLDPATTGGVRFVIE